MTSMLLTVKVWKMKNEQNKRKQSLCETSTYKPQEKMIDHKV